MKSSLVPILLVIEVLAAVVLAWVSGDFVGSFFWWLAAVISLAIVNWWFKGRRDQAPSKKVRRVPEGRSY